MPNPGLDQLLIRTALDFDLRRRLSEDPDGVFAEFDLTAEERDLLRNPDHRLLPLFGRLLAGQNKPDPPQAPAAPPQPVPGGPRTLPDISLALTVVPCRVADSYSYAVWVNTDAPPPGVTLPGQPLTPLRVILHLNAIEYRDAAGEPQVGLTAALRQSSNISAAMPASEPVPPPASPAHIWIAGLGIQTVNHTTREVEQAVRASREVLYLDTGVATRTYLESLCPRVTSLYDQSYSEDHERLSAYEHMAAAVIDAALDHPPVTFAIHGHPLVAVHAPFLILQRARELNLNVAVLPGISGLDTILADLRIDPVINGIQMYEATDLLLRRRPLDATVPAILWQIGPLETVLHTLRPSRPERFTRFVNHLLLFYPPGHEVAAIYSAPHPIMPPTILRFALEDMGLHAAELHTGFTLYVPPTSARPIQDYDLLAKLSSIDHLRTITE